jgi:hypothetical protein
MAARGEDMLLQQIPMPHPPTDAEKEQARKVICSNAEDATDAKMLLSMLGLL